MDCEPFLGSDAMRAGRITDHQLRTRYRAIHRNVYVPGHVEMTALRRAKAAWLWSGGDAVMARLSAAAVLGTKWLDPERPAELIRGDRHGPSKLLIHTWDLSTSEI